MLGQIIHKQESNNQKYVSKLIFSLSTRDIRMHRFKREQETDV